jgi:hypothetical protein
MGSILILAWGSIFIQEVFSSVAVVYHRIPEVGEPNANLRSVENPLTTIYIMHPKVSLYQSNLMRRSPGRAESGSIAIVGSPSTRKEVTMKRKSRITVGLLAVTFVVAGCARQLSGTARVTLIDHEMGLEN